MEKIVPIDTFTSILEEPSNGSMQITYFPFFENVPFKGIIPSFSSLAITHTSPPLLNVAMKVSLPIMSNFFTSSSCTFTLPWSPKILVKPALFTSLLIIFDAIPMSRNKRESSPFA